MAELYFSIGADYDKVIRLTQELDRLGKKLNEVDKAADPQIVEELEKEIEETQGEMAKLVDKAARAASELNAFNKAANPERVDALESEVEQLRKQIASLSQTTDIAAEEFDELGDNAQGSIGGISGSLRGIGGMMAGAFGIASLSQFVSQVVQTRGQMQELEVSFKTMLGSEQEADALLTQLTETAASTPFDLQGVAEGARSLLAYGTDVNDVNETLIRLGDIAAGLSIPLGDMTYLFGTTMMQGRMYAQDFQQFLGRGIPIASALAKVLQVQESEIRNMVSEGKIGAEEIKAALWEMTNDGSQFGGLMAAKSQTITGQISALGDSVSLMFNEIGESSEGMISTALSGANYLVENYKTVISTLGSLVTAYGAYKASLMGVAAFRKAEATIKYKNELEELKRLLPEKEAAINTDLKEAVAKGQLSKAQAEVIENMRKEAKNHVENLAKSAEAAEKEAKIAAERLEAAQKEAAAADRIAEEAQKNLQIAEKSGDAVAKQTAQKELQTATENKNTAAKNLNTASQKANETATAASTAKTAADTAATAANTASKQAASKATVLFSGALKKLKLALASNPIGLLLVVITALIPKLYELITAESDLEKAQKKMNEEFSKAEAAAMQEEKAMGGLRDKLSTLKEGTDEYNDTKKQLISMASKYNAELAEEIKTVGITADTYDRLSQAIRRSLMEKGYAAAAQEQQKNYGEKLAAGLKSIQEKIYDNYSDKEEAETVYKRIREALLNGDIIGNKDGDTKSLKQLRFKDDDIKDIILKNSRLFNNIAPDVMDLVSADRDNKEIEKQLKARFGIDEALTNEQKQTKQQLYDAALAQFRSATDAYTAAIRSGEAKRLSAAKEEYIKALSSFTSVGGKKENIQTYNQALTIARQGLNEAQHAYDVATSQGSDTTTAEVAELAAALKAAKEEYDKLIGGKKEKATNTAAAERATAELISQRDAFRAQLAEVRNNIDNDLRSGLTESLNARLLSVTNVPDTLAQINSFSLSQFEQFNRRRSELENDYQQKRLQAEQVADRTAREQHLRDLEISHAEALANINQEEAEYAARYSATLGSAFAKVETQTKTALQKAVSVLSQLRQRGLDGKTKVDGVSDADADRVLRSPELMAQALEQLQRAQDELTATNPFAQMMQGLINISSAAKEAAKGYDNLTDEQKQLYEQNNLSRTRQGVDMLASGLSSASSYATSISDTLANLANVSPVFEEVAQTMNDIGTVLGDTAQYAQLGGQIGGGWGALIGAVAGAGIGFASIYESSSVAAEENARNLEEYTRRVRALSTQIGNEYDKLFGVNSLEKASGAYQNARQALDNYRHALRDPEINHLGRMAQGMDEMEGFDGAGDYFRQQQQRLIDLKTAEDNKYKNVSNIFEYKKIIDDTTKSLANLDGVQTKWHKVYKLGSIDKFNKLSQYDIWQNNGNVDVEKAKIFLDTQSNITDEARAQLQAIIDMNTQYDEMIAILDKEISTFFGSWADDFTDTIFDAIYNGGDAWDAFNGKATDTIAAIGKQMAKELIVGEYLNGYQEQIRNAFASDNKGADVSKVVSEMMSGMGAVLGDVETFVKKYDAAATEAGYNLADAFSNSEEQSATRGNPFQTMSEDTASELNGRFTALQMSAERIDTATSQLSLVNTQIASIVSQSFLELQSIKQNTGNTVAAINALQTTVTKIHRKIEEL